MSLKIKTAHISDKGLNPRYTINEDSYLLLEKEGIFAVADGVGGAAAGEIASHLALETIRHSAKNFSAEAKNDPIDFVLRLIQSSNDAVWQLGIQMKQLIASTLALLFLQDTSAIIGNVGDSRIYLIRDGKLLQLSRDHSKLQELLEENPRLSLTRSEYKHGHVITRALGAAREVQADLQKVLLKNHDIFLLCTDGIYIHNTDQEILDAVDQSGDDLEDICRRLKKNCYDRGAHDNLTAVIVQITKN